MMKSDKVSSGFLTKSGFTLIEIMVAMAAGTVIIIVLYGIYVYTAQLQRKNSNQQELTQNGRIALERMSRDIRQAELITTTLPPTDTDILNPAPSNIQFQDGHYTTKIRYIKYYLSGTNLNRQVLHYSFSASPTTWVLYNARDSFNNLPTQTVDEDVVKADKISVLKFYGSPSINIKLTALNTDGNFTFSTIVFGRNI
jgi:prepilin-type N-terminal cleavage/methylation domain-containing protein